MIQIIEAQETDVLEIVEIWKDFMDYHKQIDPFFSRRKDGHHNFEKYIINCMKSSDSYILVARKEDNVIGYSLATIEKHPPVFHIEKYGYIVDIVVAHSYWRKGIGEHFLKKILQWFSTNNIKRIELKVAVGNKIGYSFYKKHGFTDYLHVLYVNKKS